MVGPTSPLKNKIFEGLPTLSGQMVILWNSYHLFKYRPILSSTHAIFHRHGEAAYYLALSTRLITCLWTENEHEGVSKKRHKSTITWPCKITRLDIIIVNHAVQKDNKNCPSKIMSGNDKRPHGTFKRLRLLKVYQILVAKWSVYATNIFYLNIELYCRRHI